MEFWKVRCQSLWRVAAATLLLLVAMGPAGADTVRGKRGVVASVNPLATKAGIAAMEAGGNAVDAAIATAITLGVVDGHNSGLGGGCFILIRRADGTLAAIDGREMAPAAATRDMFIRDGEADPDLSRIGPLAVGVPGALAAYAKASRLYGSGSIETPLRSAAQIAEDGFVLDSVYAGKLAAKADELARFPGSKALLLKPDGTPYREGERLRLPDLARTYRMIARHGTEWFYEGELAEKIAAWMEANGGLITAVDFANYQAREREPIRSTYRGYEVVGFPPPSSGGIHVAQILNTLEPFDLPTLFREEPATAYHLTAEAMKLAFADRAYWLGDGDYAPVPRGLVSKAYAAMLAQRIERDKAIDVPTHGMPPNAETDLYGKHTTHIAAADAAGNWVAITATVNTTFGSKVVVPGTGLVLNNEMDDFSAQPGKPNAFGLVGAEANAVAPGKRPLSSMSPTIVLKDGEPVLTVGAAGGPKIITQAVLCILRYLDAGQPLPEAVAGGRIHHQWFPDKLYLERAFDAAPVDSLRQRGHEIEYLSSGGITQAIARDDEAAFIAVSDPRVPGKALAVAESDSAHIE